VPRHAGRTGIYELLDIDAEAKRLIHAGGGEQPLRDHALAQGMQSLRQDGMRWVFSGVTALEELVRVTRES
jgi:general secretion pathway protein E